MNGHGSGTHRKPSHGGRKPTISTNLDHDPVVIFWEVTRACALKCEHCRAQAQPTRHPLELDTEESLRVMDELTRQGLEPRRTAGTNRLILMTLTGMRCS